MDPPIPATARATSPAPELESEKLISIPPTPSISPSTAPLSKEEKLAEIARRKEERRQRIANLKQQNNANKE